MDSIDHQLLTILQQKGDATKAELARRVELTSPAVLERLKKLRERGVLRRTTAVLDPELVGFSCLAFIQVQTDPPRTDEVARELAQVDGVQEVHHVAGDDCLLIKVRCADTQALSKLLREQFHGRTGVRSTRSTIVLETVKESSALPILS
jgi:Lrp/AsnC family leucine-responsive transcriptional regulator